MPDPNEKAAWFNSLPFIVGNYPNIPHQRTCPCGESIWYFQPGLIVLSWIDIHFGHTAPEKKLAIFEYDWSIPWKFSAAGFEALVKELGLSHDGCEGSLEFAKDPKGRRFTFRRCDHKNPIKNKYEGVYLTFIPNKNEVT